MNEMKVCVCYAASPEEQIELPVVVCEGASVQEALLQSGILARYPEIHLENCALGIYSKRTTLDAKLKSGDRIEIYRPLSIDPKDARRARAKKR